MADQIASQDGLMIIILIIALIVAAIFWYRGRKLKKEVKELKAGKIKTTRWHKLLVALGFRKDYKPPHGGFGKGDVNIRVYRTCKGKLKRKK